MTEAEQAIGLQQALAATGAAAVLALPLGFALGRLGAAWAATLGALLLPLTVLPLAVLPLAVLPLTGLAALAAQAAPLVPFIALPLGWALRRMPAATLRIAASLAPPGLVFRTVWLRLAGPWLLASLGLGLVRALADAGLAAPAAVLLAVIAWPVLWALAPRDG